MKEAILMAAQKVGGFGLSRRLTRRSLRILCYHGLWTTPGIQYGDKLFMPPELFEARIKWLANSDYSILPLREAVKRLANGTLPPHAIAITIDDGWKSTYTHMLPVLEKFGLPATVYVATYYVERQQPVVNVAADYIVRACRLKQLDLTGYGDLAVLGVDTPEKRAKVGRAAAIAIDGLPTLENRVEALRELANRAEVGTAPWWDNGQFHLLTTEELRDAQRRGLDIQLHTHRHRIPQEHSRLSNEIADNRRALTAACGDCTFDHFCYPSGKQDPRYEDALIRSGIRSATMIDEGINPPGTHPLRLRRLLDGRSISQLTFEAYLSGTLELLAQVRRMGQSRRSPEVCSA